MTDYTQMHFETKAIHVGQEPDPATVRLSIGLGHAHDLIADLDQALAGI